MLVLLLSLLLLFARGASAQRCAVTTVGCSGGNSTWWEGCASARIGGGSIAVDQASFVGVPANNLLIIQKRSATTMTTSPTVQLPLWTTLLSSGPSGPVVQGVNFDQILIRSSGVYEVTMQIGAWGFNAGGPYYTGIFSFWLQEATTNAIRCSTQPCHSQSDYSAYQPHSISTTCAFTAEAGSVWKIYGSNAGGGYDCQEPNVEHVCNLFIQQLPAVL